MASKDQIPAPAVNQRVILCGGVSAAALPAADPKPLCLRRWPPKPNVRLTISDLHRALWRPLPAALEDLLDVAVYVYCADQAVRRDGVGVDDFGRHWRRRLFFRIPVRQPDLWRSRPVREALVSTLSFLSEDEYHFEFEPLRREHPFQQCLQFSADDTPVELDDVMLYSGGVDSLGGAVQEAVVDRRRVALVSHRPTEKLASRHRQLLKELRRHAGATQLVHIPVRINKAQSLGVEYTQRSRSFLYVALAATIARMAGLNRVRFYENGVVSLNLPPSAQVVGARATRTTHPRVLRGFQALLTAVAGERFRVENCFLWKTKTEVVRLIQEAGCGDLLRLSTSCTRTWENTLEHPHCGTCSQCIDRRFAVLAAGQEAADPAHGYAVDLLTGARQAGEPRTMLAAYLETVNAVERMTAVQFFSRFGEASRALRHLDGVPEVVGMQLFDLYQRHARQVTGVIDRAIARHGAAIRRRELSPSCLIRLVADSGPGAALAFDPTFAPAPRRLPTPMAPHSIIRRERVWAIRYAGGRERLYLPEIGFDYLQVLLEHPGVSFTAAELYSRVRRRARPAPATNGAAHAFSTANGHHAAEVLDAPGRASLRLRLAEVDAGLAALRDSDLPTRLDEIDELEKERTWIMTVLGQAQGLHGTARRLGDDRNRVRNRVCNAVRRACAEIAVYDRPLAEHLAKPVLNLGHHLSYVPRADLCWATTLEPVNQANALLHEM